MVVVQPPCTLTQDHEPSSKCEMLNHSRHRGNFLLMKILDAYAEEISSCETRRYTVVADSYRTSEISVDSPLWLFICS